jgi:hypothetical protein
MAEEETCLTHGAARFGRPGRQVKRKQASRRSFGPKKREAFFAALASSANIRHATRAAGVSLSRVYQLRNQDPGFARDWHKALAAGLIDLELELLERARKGSKTTVTRSDGTSEVRHGYSDRLAMFLLSRHQPRPPEGVARVGRSPEEICAELERRIAAMNGAAT